MRSRRYRELEERLEALEEWRAACEQDDDDEVPDFSDWKPVKHKDHSGTPLDAQVLMREWSAEMSYGWWDGDDWTVRRPDYL